MKSKTVFAEYAFCGSITKFVLNHLHFYNASIKENNNFPSIINYYKMKKESCKA